MLDFIACLVATLCNPAEYATQEAPAAEGNLDQPPKPILKTEYG
jgi:hypothetical protein